MKYVLSAFLLLLTFQVRANSIAVGCAGRTYDCTAMGCRWGTDIGEIADIDLIKTGTAPGYEIWQGNTEGSVSGNLFRLSVYQRREADKIFNFLSIDLVVKGIKLTARGENAVDNLYLDESNQYGVGVHCSSNISSPDSQPDSK